MPEPRSWLGREAAGRGSSSAVAPARVGRPAVVVGAGGSRPPDPLAAGGGTDRQPTRAPQPRPAPEQHAGRGHPRLGTGGGAGSAIGSPGTPASVADHPAGRPSPSAFAFARAPAGCVRSPPQRRANVVPAASDPPPFPPGKANRFPGRRMPRHRSRPRRRCCHPLPPEPISAAVPTCRPPRASTTPLRARRLRRRVRGRHARAARSHEHRRAGHRRRSCNLDHRGASGAEVEHRRRRRHPDPGPRPLPPGGRRLRRCPPAGAYADRHRVPARRRRPRPTDAVGAIEKIVAERGPARPRLARRARSTTR